MRRRRRRRGKSRRVRGLVCRYISTVKNSSHCSLQVIKITCVCVVRYMHAQNKACQVFNGNSIDINMDTLTLEKNVLYIKNAMQKHKFLTMYCCYNILYI